MKIKVVQLEQGRTHQYVSHTMIMNLGTNGFMMVHEIFFKSPVIDRPRKPGKGGEDL